MYLFIFFYFRHKCGFRMYWICNFSLNKLLCEYIPTTSVKRTSFAIVNACDFTVMVGNIVTSVKFNEKKVQKNYLFGKNSYALCSSYMQQIQNNSLLNLHYAHSIWLGKQHYYLKYILLCHSESYSDTKCETCFLLSWVIVV